MGLILLIKTRDTITFTTNEYINTVKRVNLLRYHQRMKVYKGLSAFDFIQNNKETTARRPADSV